MGHRTVGKPKLVLASAAQTDDQQQQDTHFQTEMAHQEHQDPQDRQTDCKMELEVELGSGCA